MQWKGAEEIQRGIDRQDTLNRLARETAEDGREDGRLDDEQETLETETIETRPAIEVNLRENRRLVNILSQLTGSFHSSTPFSNELTEKDDHDSAHGLEKLESELAAFAKNVAKKLTASQSNIFILNSFTKREFIAEQLEQCIEGLCHLFSNSFKPAQESPNSAILTTEKIVALLQEKLDDHILNLQQIQSLTAMNYELQDIPTVPVAELKYREKLVFAIFGTPYESFIPVALQNATEHGLQTISALLLDPHSELNYIIKITKLMLTTAQLMDNAIENKLLEFQNSDEYKKNVKQELDNFTNEITAHLTEDQLKQFLLDPKKQQEFIGQHMWKFLDSATPPLAHLIDHTEEHRTTRELPRKQALDLFRAKLADHLIDVETIKRLSGASVDEEFPILGANPKLSYQEKLLTSMEGLRCSNSELSQTVLCNASETNLLFNVTKVRVLAVQALHNAIQTMMCAKFVQPVQQRIQDLRREISQLESKVFKSAKKKTNPEFWSSSCKIVVSKGVADTISQLQEIEKKLKAKRDQLLLALNETTPRPRF